MYGEGWELFTDRLSSLFLTTKGQKFRVNCGYHKQILFCFTDALNKILRYFKHDLMFLSFSVGKEDIINYDGAQLAEEGKTPCYLSVKLSSVLSKIAHYLFSLDYVGI
jgi:hypothetical protein